VEEPAPLMPMQRVVGSVEVEDDLLGRRPVRFEKEFDEQPLDGRPIVADPVIARGCPRRMLKWVQGALAGERGAVLALGPKLADERRQHRIVAQLIMVDQVLIAERDPEHPLRHHGRDAVLNHARTGSSDVAAPLALAFGAPTM